MSGHSKWSNIKRKKGILDAQKGKIFSKMSHLITVAAKQGGGNPDANPSLRLAIDRAKAAKMPKENIDRAIKKGTGVSGGQRFEEVIYEGYGPEGVAFFLKGMTDNKNRTVAGVRNIFDKAGGSLGATGSTSYIFADDFSNPSFQVGVEDANKKQKILALIKELESHNDIEEVYTNIV